MSYQLPEEKDSSVNWTAVILIVGAFIIAFTVGIVFAVNSIQSASSKTGTDIAKRIEAPQNQADYAAVQNDVRNAVLAVQTAAAQNPSGDLSATPLTASNPQTQLSVAGNSAQFTITGTYAPTGYQYQYSSATGSFSVINPGADLATTGATR